MRIEIEGLSPKGINLIRMLHGKEDVLWATPGYSSASIPERDKLFDDFNKYVSRLTKEQQDKLWNIYMDVRDVIATVSDPTLLDIELKKLVVQLYEVVTYADCRRYVYHGGDVMFPENLKTEYTESDLRSRNYQDRTYLRDEYIDLVILTLGYRFMIPIWGEYIQRVSSRTANEYKETAAFDLTSLAAINEWPPTIRLKRYVDASVLDSKASMAVLLFALSTVEIPKHLLALAVVRKLAVSPLSPRNSEDNLIKVLYNHVTGTANRLDTRFGGNIGQKKLVKDSAEDDNSSVWDMYKINQDIPDGDKILMEVYTENPLQMARQIYGEVNEDRVRKCLNVTTKLDNLEIHPHHVAITQWIMGKVISPRGVQTLPKQALLRAMGVTQAVLWDWGFLELAVLVTAERQEAEDQEMFQDVAGRSRVEASMKEKLNELYPHWRRNTRRFDPAKRTNVAINAIDTLADQLNRCIWLPNAPKQLLEEFDNISVTRQWIVSGNIKMQLAELIVRLNSN